jgi:hypothetical protein
MEIISIYFLRNFNAILRQVHFRWSEFLFFADIVMGGASFFFNFLNMNIQRIFYFYSLGDPANVRNREVRNHKKARDDCMYHTLWNYPTRFMYWFWMILTVNSDCFLKSMNRFSLVVEIESDVGNKILNNSLFVWIWFFKLLISL